MGSARGGTRSLGTFPARGEPRRTVDELTNAVNAHLHRMGETGVEAEDVGEALDQLGHEPVNEPEYELTDRQLLQVADLAWDISWLQDDDWEGMDDDDDGGEE